MSLPNLFITLFSLLTSLAYASHPRSNITRTCGSASSPHLLQHAAEFAVLDLSDEEILSGTISPRSQKRHVIETYFHVLAANKTLEGGWVPKELLKKQLEVIQDNFKPSKFAFKLKGTTYSIYSNWTATGPDLKTRKKLRKGTRQTLNVYIVSQFEEYLQTGWLGLFHTFEGWNCIGPGDFVDDTPAQALPVGSCYAPIVWDTCPDQPGLDAVHNYMDYTEE
ncbi:hypothetical protein IFR04_000934 [Cadophora malorum]|uniref:Uncharacterized protein n=1 Tax=Cadophora malorum TaxID=108018 RepID=A0A8H8BVU3_9HELO|nr:hypothetical protein IFR04_000934 [Cadophora malorum]